MIGEKVSIYTHHRLTSDRKCLEEGERGCVEEEEGSSPVWVVVGSPGNKWPPPTQAPSTLYFFCTPFPLELGQKPSLAQEKYP